MGSDSDLPVMSSAAKMLEQFQVTYEITVVSAHRTPERMLDYVKNARVRGIKIIIAAAGGAAHLPGMAASLTSLPVIGVPIKTSKLDGLDSLLSIVQMPEGIPVATVAINGAANAALLAVRILGAQDSVLAKKMQSYQNSLRDTVQKKAKNLELRGYKKYLKQITGVA